MHYFGANPGHALEPKTFVLLTYKNILFTKASLCRNNKNKLCAYYFSANVGVFRHSAPQAVCSILCMYVCSYVLGVVGATSLNFLNKI